MIQRILARRGHLITEKKGRWWTLGAMCFALFMIMLDKSWAVGRSETTDPAGRAP